MQGDDKLQTKIFDTRTLPPAARLQAWAESIGVLFDVGLENGSGPRRFQARVEATMMGAVLLGSVASRSQRFERPANKILGDGLDHLLVQVFLSGFCTILEGGRTRTVCPGDIYIIDASAPLQAEDYGFSHVTAMVPRDLLAPTLVTPDAHHRRIIPREAPLARLIYDFIGTLHRSRFEMTEAEGLAVQGPLLSLVVSALNGCCSRTGSVDADEAAVDLAMLKTARACIADHLVDRDLDVATVALALGMSRSRLYRLFQPLGGVASYIRKRRLRGSLRDLLSEGPGSLLIGELAYRWGFGSESDYSRAFRRQYGCRPRDARAARSIWSLENIAGDDRAGFDLWIRELSR